MKIGRGFRIILLKFHQLLQLFQKGARIAKLPVDPYWKNGRINKYRYRSDGNGYALLFYMELGPCMTGVGAAATGPWDGHTITTCAF